MCTLFSPEIITGRGSEGVKKPKLLGILYHIFPSRNSTFASSRCWLLWLKIKVFLEKNPSADRGGIEHGKAAFHRQKHGLESQKWRRGLHLFAWNKLKQLEKGLEQR